MTENSGHGWVRWRPGGYKEPCGGPPLCASCHADVQRLASSQSAVSADRAAFEREIQHQFDRARAE